MKNQKMTNLSSMGNISRVSFSLVSASSQKHLWSIIYMPKSKYNLNESKANRKMHVLCTEKNNYCSNVNEQSDIWIGGVLEMWKFKLVRFSDICWLSLQITREKSKKIFTIMILNSSSTSTSIMMTKSVSTFGHVLSKNFLYSLACVYVFFVF